MEAQVKVGKVVELTREEQRRIEELANVMHRLAITRRKGWFAPFVQSLTELNRLVHSAVGRSHAS